jgi:site-specific DNA-methyltransferase (adenine-specific)
MGIEDIASFLFDNEIETDKNSVCFMWATVPLLDEAFYVMKSWGFKYKTMYTWNKTSFFGMGFWFRVNTEHLLVGVKGKVKPFGMQIPNIINHKILKHSEKPAYFRNLVEQCAEKSFDKPRYLELFGRERIQGWDVIGNQLPDNKTVRLI